jgi:hypothetical protein
LRRNKGAPPSSSSIEKLLPTNGKGSFVRARALQLCFSPFKTGSGLGRSPPLRFESRGTRAARPVEKREREESDVAFVFPFCFFAHRLLLFLSLDLSTSSSPSFFHSPPGSTPTRT